MKFTYNTFTFALLWVLFLTLTSCESSKANINEIPADQVGSKQKKRLAVVINDLSKVSNRISINSKDLSNLYEKVAETGGTVYGLSILSDSYYQDPFIFDVKAGIESKLTNPIKKERETRLLDSMFTIQKTIFLDSASHYFLKKPNERFSDIATCLSMAKVILSSNRFDNYYCYVLVNSNMLNDIPWKDGENKVAKKNYTDFEDLANLILVKPKRTYYVNALSSSVVTNFSDAIKEISLNNHGVYNEK